MPFFVKIDYFRALINFYFTASVSVKINGSVGAFLGEMRIKSTDLTSAPLVQTKGRARLFFMQNG